MCVLRFDLLAGLLAERRFVERLFLRGQSLSCCATVEREGPGAVERLRPGGICARRVEWDGDRLLSVYSCEYSWKAVLENKRSMLCVYGLSC
jgi:hypothetical protein